MARVGNAKRELAQMAGQVPANISSARDRLDDQLKGVLTAIGKRDNAQTEQSLQSLETTLAVIEKYLWP